MYNQPDDDEPDEELDIKKVVGLPGVKPFDFELSGKFVTLTVDGRTIDVPSARYVNFLERTITDQARQLLRMNSEIKKQRAALNGLIGDINDVNRELDRKINMRDLP